MSKCLRAALVLSFLLLLLGVSAEQPWIPKLRVPDGFVIEQVAGDPDVVFPMFACFDDRGRLFVAESSGLDLYAELQKQTRKCRIRVLEDPDENGRYRKSQVYADQLVFPMGLAWRDGKLYVADPPDLVVYEDTKGTGKADKRTVILTGFGHKDNGSLHGLAFGPDGLLYLTMGDPDGYKLKRRDGTFLQGRCGALLRCRADGSDPEVLCRGFENLVEVVFTPRGEIIGTDNWYRNVNQKESGGLRDALVHLVDGGLYPRHLIDQGTPKPITGEPLPPISLFPAVALSGLTLDRGPMFPTEMRGQLFSAQHNSRKVGRHVLVPAGSTFTCQDFDFVTTDDPDFHPSDVLQDADGSLLVIDTGSWYVHHCPTGQIRKTQAKGGIYRVRHTKAERIDDPWGLKLDWREPEQKRAWVDSLAHLLGDRRPAVVERARLLLSKQGAEAVPRLTALLESGADVTVKQQAVWALAAMTSDAPLAALRKLLRHLNPDLVAPAARGLGLHRDRTAAPDLCHLLLAQHSQVRMAAAEALARCGDAQALPALWKALIGEPDRFFEHTLIHALHHCADAAALNAALREPQPRVQKAALLLLDQPPRPTGSLKADDVIQRVSSTDADLRQTALNILKNRPEWAEQAIGLVRAWLEKPAVSAEEQAGLRSLIMAFQAQGKVQELIAATLAEGSKTPADRQVLVLETLAQSSLTRLPQSWIDGLARALQRPDAAIRGQAVRSAAILQVPQLDEPLGKLVENKEEPAALRLEALRAIVLRRPKPSPAAFDLLLAQLEEKVSPLARLTTAEVIGKCQLADAQLSQLLKKVRGDALVSPSVLLPALQRSVSETTAPELLAYLIESLKGGWRPGEAELNKALAALPASFKEKAGPVRELWKKGIEEQRARLTAFEPLLTGGSVENGRKVFFSQKVPCATCHRVGNEGGPIGPDLTRIGAIRAGRDLLESIVLPSSTIAQGFESYVIATADGRIVTGLIARQTADTLFLRDSSGAELRLRKDQIQEMNRSPTSLMPEGLDKQMTKEEFRDLLAYLQSLK